MLHKLSFSLFFLETKRNKNQNGYYSRHFHNTGTELAIFSIRSLARYALVRCTRFLCFFLKTKRNKNQNSYYSRHFHNTGTELLIFSIRSLACGVETTISELVSNKIKLTTQITPCYLAKTTTLYSVITEVQTITPPQQRRN